MKVLDPGHRYELAIIDGDESFARVLQFVKREGEGYPGNVGHHEGTNIQDVLRVLIDRVKYLNNQIHDGDNLLVLFDLRNALWRLESRAARRHGRILEAGIGNIENEQVCAGCGHIGCGGSCG